MFGPLRRGWAAPPAAGSARGRSAHHGPGRRLSPATPASAGRPAAPPRRVGGRRTFGQTNRIVTGAGSGRPRRRGRFLRRGPLPTERTAAATRPRSGSTPSSPEYGPEAGLTVGTAATLTSVGERTPVDGRDVLVARAAAPGWVIHPVGPVSPLEPRPLRRRVWPDGPVHLHPALLRLVPLERAQARAARDRAATRPPGRRRPGPQAVRTRRWRSPASGSARRCQGPGGSGVA
jgi:hypothetical protein